MHSLQSLRQIRAFQYFLYGGLSEQEFHAYRPESTRKIEPRKASLLSTIRYDPVNGLSITEERAGLSQLEA